MNLWTVEVLDAFGAVVHGYSIKATTAEAARLEYMRQMDRPAVRADYTVQVTPL